MRGLRSWIVLAALMPAHGADASQVVDVAISTNPLIQGPDRSDFQSETSMARIDAYDAFERPGSHYVTVYNDGSQAEVAVPTAPACWTYAGTRSLDGWSTSDDLGRTWARHPQLLPLPGSPFQARHGDVSVASWNNPNFRYLVAAWLGSGGVIQLDGSVVLMVSVAQPGPDPYAGPWGIYANRMLYEPGDSTIDLT